MGNYDDILYLPHHRSTRHSHMSMLDRAAQFSPFAALTGFDAAIQETGRLTDSRTELEAYGNDLLDCQLSRLLPLLPQHPEIHVTYFLPDPRKAGGAYTHFQGRLKKIDTVHQRLLFLDGRDIPMGEILSIQCDALDET